MSKEEKKSVGVKKTDPKKKKKRKKRHGAENVIVMWIDRSKKQIELGHIKKG